MNKILQSLYLNLPKIEENLQLRKGAQCAEHLMIRMADKIGRQKAHDLLKKLSNEENFMQAVKNNSVISEYFSIEEIEEILDPKNYLGLSTKIVDNLTNYDD